MEPLAYYEPDPDLLGLASTLLLSGPAAPVIGDQQLLPWTLQPATMAQQVVAPPPQAQQFVAQHACQMPDLQMVHTNPTVQQHQQLAVAQQQQHQPQDMMAAAACHNMQPPTGYVVHSLDVPALMQMVQADPSNLQQWSSTVTSSNNNNNVGSGVSTPSSGPVARLNHSTTSTATTYGGAGASASTSNDAAAAALFNMQLSELLDVSDYM